ncbi:MAG: hypothetical protein WCP29_16070, partial [Acidobacteriota bacterium]
MSTPFQNMAAAVVAVIDATPSRIPVVVGLCGSGRTSLLQRVEERVGAARCQLVGLDRVVSTPERFFAELAAASQLSWARPDTPPATPRAAFEALAACLSSAQAPDGSPATWLLDEFLEVKTLESFPGLRHAVDETLAVVAASPARFVLTSRFVSRTLRVLHEGRDRFVVMHAPPLGVADIGADLQRIPGFKSDAAEDAARVIVALTGGQLAYATELVRALGDPGLRVRDPIAAFSALLAPGGALCRRCRQSYEFRLHRARGYGALKAILGILADDEPMTLTDIAEHMHRTPGSTKDYLGWLQDVDLVVVHRKRYSIADPVMRLWVTLHTQCRPPG